jgi:hypothetical protein
MSEQLALGRDGAGQDTSVKGLEPGADTSMAPTATGNETGYLPVFVFALFFFFGGTTSLNDVIIPRLKDLFTLSYAEVMTVQSAFFGAYFIISLPAAAVVRRIGYTRSAVVGLLLMMTGCRRRRHYGGAGGRESLDLAPRTAGHGAQPSHVCPGVQFAGHDHFSVRRLGL